MKLRPDPGERPRLDLEPSISERLLGMAAWVAVGVNMLLIFHFWPELPGTVPQHFDLRGEVDGWGPRLMVLLLPVMSAVLVGGLAWLSRYPHIFNFLWTITEENAAVQYQLAIDLLAALRATIAWLFAGMTWQICQLALDRYSPLGIMVAPLGLVLVLVGMVRYFVRAYRAR